MSSCGALVPVRRERREEVGVLAVQPLLPVGARLVSINGKDVTGWSEADALKLIALIDAKASSQRQTEAEAPRRSA